MKSINSTSRNSIDMSERPLLDSLITEHRKLIHQKPARQSLQFAFKTNPNNESYDEEAIKKSQQILKSIVSPSHTHSPKSPPPPVL